MTSAKIVCDSIGPAGIRLTTAFLKYPRIVHSELIKHRVFSSNSKSSRAVPVAKEIIAIENDPYIPEIFYKNKSGMQGGDPLSPEEQILARKYWIIAKDCAIEQAKNLDKIKVHKQHANRILEPYSYMYTALTSTDWTNFFGLRYHPDADPEIQKLAVLMYGEYVQRTPQELKAGQWHLPGIDFSNHLDHLKDAPIEIQLKGSAARMARVSYMNHEGKMPTLVEDMNLYDRLIRSENIHASPTEHQAMATGDSGIRSGNLRGWVQFRKTIKNENIKKFRELSEAI